VFNRKNQGGIVTLNKTSNFSKRYQLHKDELESIYFDVYNDNAYYPVEDTYKQLINLMEFYFTERKPALKRNDTTNAHWYKKNNIVGTTLYVDLFSEDIANFKQYIPYFTDLGITFIHFMPILQGREGENDGGYAVKNYKKIDPRFGTNEAFEELVYALKAHGIHSCIDFVVNHTAKEHEFAQKALEGDSTYMDMYLMYDSIDVPRQFEATVPEVFPKVAPGNFTYYDSIQRWVFTSFYEFQWDLNYQNPLVFEKIIDILLYLSNLGIDMIRLDAIPFMWKEIGTTCRNHPIIHKLLRLFKLILLITCPSVALLGEAIVEPEEIVKYFGEAKSECDLLYNATHMVNIWNSVATRDTRLLQIDTARLQPLSGGCWINYARCHDDIGWGFNEEAIQQFGLSPYSHKQFLINYFKGNFPGSFSIGDLYEFNEETMDARNCGTLASLVGLEKALLEKDDYQKELALKRILLIQSLLIASSALPLIYSGDEIASLNNYDYLTNPLKAHDSRWLHRGHFNHEAALNRHKFGTTEYAVFNTLKALIALRKKHEIFAPTISQTIISTSTNAVYSFMKQHDTQTLICLYNFSEDRQFFSSHPYRTYGISGIKEDLITGKRVNFDYETILLGPYEYVWLV
jgi:amylosucrase